MKEVLALSCFSLSVSPVAGGGGAPYRVGAERPHRVIVRGECGRAPLLPNVPQLDRAIGGRRQTLVT
jgi:hypothetical protein